jgi:hypothetical protein
MQDKMKVVTMHDTVIRLAPSGPIKRPKAAALMKLKRGKKNDN